MKPRFQIIDGRSYDHESGTDFGTRYDLRPARPESGRFAAAIGYCMRVRSGRYLSDWEIQEFRMAIQDTRDAIEVYERKLSEATDQDDKDFCRRHLERYQFRLEDFLHWYVAATGESVLEELRGKPINEFNVTE